MGKRLVLAIALCALTATATAADAQVVVPGGAVAHNWPTVTDPVVEVATAGCPVESDETGEARRCEPTQVAGASLLCTDVRRSDGTFERSCSIESEPAGAGCRREGWDFFDAGAWTESCSVRAGDTTVDYTCDASEERSSRSGTSRRHCTAGPVTVGEEWSSDAAYDSGALTVGVGDAGVRCVDDRTEEGHDDGYRPEDCTVTAPGSG